MAAEAPAQVTRTRSGEPATVLEAISEALWEEMERDERVFLMGEDIGAYGGAFKVTRGFLDRFGPTRVIDTPISEGGFAGAAAGPGPLATRNALLTMKSIRGESPVGGPFLLLRGGRKARAGTAADDLGRILRG